MNETFFQLHPEARDLVDSLGADIQRAIRELADAKIDKAIAGGREAVRALLAEERVAETERVAVYIEHHARDLVLAAIRGSVTEMFAALVADIRARGSK